jgi:hypothetical protein
MDHIDLSDDPSLPATAGAWRAGPAGARSSSSRRSAMAALAVLAVIGSASVLALRDAPTASERAAALQAEREQAEREQAEREQAEREQAEREQAEREQAERAMERAEDLAAEGDHLAARDAFLEVARAGGELAAVALERARESSATYVDAAMVRLEELLAEERTAEALAHLRETLAQLAGTEEVERFLELAREAVREAAAQLGPTGRALAEVLRDATAGTSVG